MLEQKLKCAVLSLEGKADVWWDSIKREYETLRQPLTWNILKTKVEKQYIPTYDRDLKATEFANLTQGDMTVAQYDAKFAELSRYAPHLAKYHKAEKFKRGLRKDIYKHVAIFRICVYADLLHRAKIAEEVISEDQLHLVEQKPETSTQIKW